MKRIKRGTALVLAGLLMASLLTTALIAANKNWITTELGALSQYYETGNSADPGYISTVSGDSGGTSYGIYMFVEKTVANFMDWLRAQPDGTTYHAMGDILYNAYAYNTKGEYYPGFGSNFRSKWQEVAQNNRTEFAQAQTAFWQDNCYTVLVNNIETLFPGFRIDDYSIALKNVFWSRSVHHGVGVISGANSSDGMSGATGVIYRAFTNRLGGFKLQSEAELIQAIYAECSKLETKYKDMQNLTASKYGIKDRSMAYFNANSGGVQTAVYSRLHVNEPSDALVMRYSNTSSPVAEGKYRLVNSADQTKAVFVDGKGAQAVESSKGTVLSLTYYQSGKYTLTASDGTRLTDTKGTVTLASPAASQSQFWTVEQGMLKNCGSGKYLFIDPATSGAYTVSQDTAVMTKWQLSYVSGADGWTTAGLFYPGCADSDGLGTPIYHNLTEGNASFPLRGIVSHPSGVTSVVVTVSGGSGFTASASQSGSTWFDLWKLDEAAKFSKLTQGQYTLTIKATNGKGETVTLVSSPLTVGAPDTSAPSGGGNDTYTVSFVNGTDVTKRTYKLGETYGALPAVSAEGFKGWFLSDGTEITANSIVAAENHTVVAQYGELHTVSFVSEGVTLSSGKLAEGSLITAPSTPVKAADSSYIYSFAGWIDGNNAYFVPGATYMGKTDIVYAAVFTKTANNNGGGGGSSGGGGGSSGGGGGGGGGGGTAPTPSGSYLTGIAPRTSVETLTAGGYTVYSGGSQIASGIVGTGMTASSGAATVTIVVTGDVNGDGKITITDVVKLQSNVAGASSLSGAYAAAADINGDGRVTITDVVQAAQITVGQRTIN